MENPLPLAVVHPLSARDAKLHVTDRTVTYFAELPPADRAAIETGICAQDIFQMVDELGYVVGVDLTEMLETGYRCAYTMHRGEQLVASSSITREY